MIGVDSALSHFLLGNNSIIKNFDEVGSIDIGCELF